MNYEEFAFVNQQLAGISSSHFEVEAGVSGLDGEGT